MQRVAAAVVVLSSVVMACGKGGSQPGDAPAVATGSADPAVAIAFADHPPEVGTVEVSPNLDSAVLTVPAVAGAADYRVFALPAGATAGYDAASGRETVDGALIHCAGIRQSNGPAAPMVPVTRIEVTDLHAPTRFVVEAIDRLCPFPGVMGAAHADVAMTNTEVGAPSRVPFSIFTEEEIRARYGSLIVNGQGPAARIGLPADANPPKVLARTQVVVSPLPATARPAMTFFDDFSESDQPVSLGSADTAARSLDGTILQNRRWTFYAFGHDAVQIFEKRGQLVNVLADAAQDVFASILAYPRQPVQLPAPGSADYLHVTWEVNTNSTSRRYWWILLCGAGAPGQTMDASGRLLSPVVPTSAFFEADGLNPSIAKWNCLHVFPRDGWPATLGPDNTNPQTDLRVMVNKPGAPDRSSVVNLSPDLYHNPSVGPPSWYRQVDASGRPSGPILDDLQGMAPRVHFDLYVRRDRVVLYANGEQRLCNDFPSNALTMAEAALSFSQVLYHSTAERMEFSLDFWPKEGQRYYLTDTPYVDSRSWDNLGYDENVPAPANFNPAVCYSHG